MSETLKQMIDIRAALWVNSFAYFFKRLWLVGKCLPDSIYSNYRLKRTLSAAAVVIRQLIDFFGKPLYLFTFAVLPFAALAGQEFAFLVQAFFFLNCVIGAFGDSQIFTVTRDKVTCIKYMHMNGRTYVKCFLAFKYLPFFLYYLPWLLFFTRLTGGTLVQGVLVWFMLLSFRMMGEAFQLAVFDRTGKVISRNMFYEWGVIGLGLAGAYLPAFLGWNWRLHSILLHPAVCAVYTVIGGVCLWYIARGYGGYEEKFHRSVDPNFLFSSLLKSSSGTSGSVKEVEIRERDAVVTEAERVKFQSLTGYAYLNALFFARHRRQLMKPVYYRLLVAALLFAASAVLVFTKREQAVAISENMNALLPSTIYIMYFMTVADKAARAMFYNCDKDLLHYAWYRQPRTILKNFQIRFLKVCLYDLAIGAAVCAAAAGFCLLCKTGIFTADLILFCATILLLSVLFTAHHLCLYYIFQPYSENLQIKNPFYSVINGGMFMVCFLCLNIKAGSLLFTSAVFILTVVYIAAALILVYRRAPRSFRVK